MKRIATKCLFLAALAALAFARPAWAAGVRLLPTHQTKASLVDGKSVYTGAAFDAFNLQVGDPMDPFGEGGLTYDVVKATGSMTIFGGSYTFGDTVVDGTNETFDLRCEGSDGDELSFDPYRDGRKVERFEGAAETGLPGKTVNWTFPAGSGLNSGTATIPAFRTTVQQLGNDGYVPYVELERSNGKVTKVTWRVVKASDPATALTMDIPFLVNCDIWLRNGEVLYLGDNKAKANEKLEWSSTPPARSSRRAAVDLPAPTSPVTRRYLPIDEAEIDYVMVFLVPGFDRDDLDLSKLTPYRWDFVPSTPGSKADQSGIDEINKEKNVTPNEEKTTVTITIPLTGGKQLIGNIVYFWLRLGKLLTADEASIAAAAGDLYGPYEGKLDADGKLKIDVNALKPVNGSGAPTSISAGEYDILVQGKTDANTQPDMEKTRKIEGVSLAATKKESGGGSSGGGGCSSAGIGGLGLALGLALLLRRKA